MALSGRRQHPELGGERRRRVQTEGHFRKCDNRACGQTLVVKELEKNQYCCKHCGHHFRIGSRKRVEITLDPGSWIEYFEEIEPVDPLEFKGKRSYLERIKESMEKTGLKDAVICGEGQLEGQRLVFCAMDFQFMGGTMGSVVGEKIARAIEFATQRRWPLVMVCCSGGARMDEGVLSLMQMAKTSAALQRHHAAGLLYISVLTDPTLAGVSASFAFLADVILGEPKAMIGFTGARVIEQTIKVKLPPGFQEAEFLLKHGQIDKVVPRKEIRATLAQILSYASWATPVTPTPPTEPAGASEPGPASTPEKKKKRRSEPSQIQTSH